MARVVICGSINIDVVATVNRLPVPGETVAGSNLATYPGGKGANQAVAAARSGADVVMLGAVGGDAHGTQLRSFLTDHGIDTSRLAIRAAEATGTALILVDRSAENVIVVVPGANATVDATVAASADLNTDDVLVAQFETPLAATLTFFRDGAGANAIKILNPAPAAEIPSELLELVNVLVVNETELAFLTGGELTDESRAIDLEKADQVLRQAGFDGSLVVTLGERGVVSRSGGETLMLDGHRVPVVDTTGAGDCFVGCLAARLAQGAQLDIALRYANAASALAVQTPGAGSAMPRHDQVQAFLQLEG